MEAPISTPNALASKRSMAMAILIVGVAVVLNVVSGVVLKSLATQAQLNLLLLAGGVALVVAINLVRFVVWAAAHRRYPLSTTFPLSSIFYPIMLGLAYYYREPVHLNQWLGTLLITLGVVWLTWKVET